MPRTGAGVNRAGVTETHTAGRQVSRLGPKSNRSTTPPLPGWHRPPGTGILPRESAGVDALLAASFDTYAAAKRLRDAGFDERQAEAAVSIVRDAAGAGRDDLATKADIAALKGNVDALRTATKADIAELQAATKADIAELQAATKADIAELQAATKANIAELQAATKANIAELQATTKADIAALKGNVDALRTATKADIAELQAATKADIAALDARLTWRLVGIAAAIIAAVKLIPGIDAG